MSKIKIYIILLFCFSCLWAKDQKTAVINIENSVKGHKVIIEIIPGNEWIHKEPYNSPPQFAIWIVNSEGKYVDTIYVTKKTAKQGWRFSGGSRREESLPYWAYSRGVKYKDSLYLPTKKDPLPDGITSSTPEAGSKIYTELPEQGKNVVVFIEINHSVDWNNFYPENSGTNGQPSVVYSSVINIDKLKKGEKFYFKALGVGSSDGKSGKLFANLKSLTTALEIVDEISLEKNN